MPKRPIELKEETSTVNNRKRFLLKRQPKRDILINNGLIIKTENKEDENNSANMETLNVSNLGNLRRSNRGKENLVPNYTDVEEPKIKKSTKRRIVPTHNKGEVKASASDIVNTKKEDLSVKKSKLQKKVVKKENKSKSVEIPVDSVCTTKLGKAEVFIEGDDIYDVMLNQTNLQFNNNKFYIIQLLKDLNTDNYSVWMRWARVGKVGQMKLTAFGNNLAGAKSCFCQKFFDKTRNHWDDRLAFEKINGKYDLVHIDYVKKDIIQKNETEKKVKLETLDCKLEDKLQDLLRIIFDIKEMNSAVSGMNYDSDRLPLGRLTEAQIKAGYKALREIEGLLSEGYTSNKLVAACNNYYTRIPHDFGMKVPPVIRTLVEIKRELELLETLSDIKITLALMELGDVNVHHLDRQYESLKCDIRPLSQQDETYKLLNNYLLKTHGNTHKDYALEMLDLFEITKQNEWDNFKDYGNRMLLWHGSRTTNYGGILSQGLRIAPKEAPVTGHMFGKGVYFSDMSSKSANYIYPTKTKNVGFLLLCEVSLGKSNELTKANERAAKLPKDMQSVLGRGIICPDPGSWVTTPDGMVVPVGEPRDTGLAEKQKGYLLNYNEYIVYDRNQIKMRYMMKVKFNYKK